jgi:nitroreductase
MNISKGINIILVIVVCVLVFKIIYTKLWQKNTEKKENANVILENIYTRTSIRAYQDRPVEDQKVEQILRAAMSAPTAVNKQPWAFVVINQKEKLKQLADSLPYAKMLHQAPLAIVVCGDLTKALPGDGMTYWIQDASAATENLLLATHAVGLGAVWTGVFPIEERVKTVQRTLQMPDSIIPLCVVPIGYPAEKPSPKDKWNKSNIHMNQW